jgi:hypothetical protein
MLSSDQKSTAPATGRVRIDLYYDTISPYSWLAFEALLRYRSIWDCELALRPMYLGAVMKSTDNRPPGLVPAKAAYMTADLARLGPQWGLRLVQHPEFPTIMFNGLAPIRLVTAAEVVLADDRKLSAADVASAVEKVSRAIWYGLCCGCVHFLPLILRCCALARCASLLTLLCAALCPLPTAQDSFVVDFSGHCELRLACGNPVGGRH